MVWRLSAPAAAAPRTCASAVSVCASALRLSSPAGGVFVSIKGRRAPPGLPPSISAVIISNYPRADRISRRVIRIIRSKELAASNSNKLEKAGPVLGGATAVAGAGEEIGIDPPSIERERETPEQRNKFLVLRLYEALNARDHAAVQSLLAPDLEWWFHGPPKHQHMMRLLTGTGTGFRFVPGSVDALNSSVVIAEGAGQEDIYWVHAWTVGADGVITQLREYFNTDLTVTRLGLAAVASAKCVWQSHRPNSATNSLPGLLLAL